MKKDYTLQEVEAILTACFDEFCEIIGDIPCGCEICPYCDSEGQEECRKAYMEKKLKL